MRRFTLPLVILASVALAAFLTWVALTSATFGNRPPRAEFPGGRESAAISALPPFAHVKVSGMAEVTLVQGATESVALPAASRKHGLVTAEVRDDTLYVRAEDSSRWWDWIIGGGRDRTLQVTVTFRNLESITAAGTVKLTAGDVKVPDLKISGAGGTAVKIDNLQVRTLRLAGAGALKAEIAGRAVDQAISISGAGDYRGARLVSQSATVSVAGAGRVVINAERTLKATISGAGSIEYLGDPEVTEQVSGAGRVRRRDASGAGSGIAFVR